MHQQVVRRIHIADDRIQQPVALGNASRQFPPLLRVEQQRKQVDVPRAGVTGIFAGRVGDAIFLEQPAGFGHTPVQLLDAQLVQPRGQRLPVFADHPRGIHQFVIRIGPRSVACENRGPGRRGLKGIGNAHAVDLPRRRSKVSGKQGFGSSSGICSGPPVCPWQRTSPHVAPRPQTH